MIKNGKKFGNYWDKHLVHLIEFGFPLDFTRNSVLHHDGKIVHQLLISMLMFRRIQMKNFSMKQPWTLLV